MWGIGHVRTFDSDRGTRRTEQIIALTLSATTLRGLRSCRAFPTSSANSAICPWRCRLSAFHCGCRRLVCMRVVMAMMVMMVVVVMMMIVTIVIFLFIVEVVFLVAKVVLVIDDVILFIIVILVVIVLVV